MEQKSFQWLRKIDDPIAAKLRNPNATILHINDMHLLVMEQQQQPVEGHDAASVPATIFVHLTNDEGTVSSSKTFVNQLIIPSVQRTDAGRYFCVVTNAAGQFVYQSAYLQVVNG